MFSLVMPTCNDFDGVAFSLKAAQLYHAAFINDIVVVDNCPNGAVAATTENFVKSAGGRYVPYTEKRGTAAAKNEAIRQAKNDWVICIDSHVLLYPLAVKDIVENWASHSEYGERTLFHGPIMQDTGRVMATHFDPEWRGEMYGVWGLDEERLAAGLPFEIPGMGMGCFAVNKKFWMGYHPDFEGFGGEEMYIHEKYRQAGGKVVCVPQFKWWHRFARPGGMTYRHTIEEKVVNYVIGWRDLGWPLDDIHAAFVATKLITEAKWEKIVGGWKVSHDEAIGEFPTTGPSLPLAGPGCNTCGGKAKTMAEYLATPSDINEHLPALNALAKECKVIVDCGTSHETVAAFHDGNTNTVHAARGGDSSLSTSLVDCDLLFLDTDPHSADHVYAELSRWKGNAKRYIVLHDTEIFGEAYAGGPGILPAVRQFQNENPEWVTVAHYANNNGLTVLSCQKKDYPPDLPPLWRRAKNLTVAAMKDIANGRKRASLTVVEQRVAICTSNGGRCPSGRRRIDDNSCSKCGCPLTEKTKWPLEVCPLGHWGETDDVIDDADSSYKEYAEGVTA